MSNTSVVAFVPCIHHQQESLRLALETALIEIGQPLQGLIRAGDRVLIKPYLRHGNTRRPESRMVSHPALIETIVEMVKDCGGRPLIGDEGSRQLHDQPIHRDSMWLHLLAERTGAELVSFAKAGGRLLSSDVPHLKRLLLSRAVTDADLVLNLANAQPHGRLIWSGAIKNMLNAVIGECGNRLFELLHDDDSLALATAEVCRLSKPGLSFIDMIDICPGSGLEMWRPGLIGVSADPVALDTVAVSCLGWDAQAVPSIRQGTRIGLGQSQPEFIELRGLRWEALPILNCPLPGMVPRPPETPTARALRTLNKTLLRPRPIIHSKTCSQCGDCARICPVQAIHFLQNGLPRIDYALCADCMVCAEACRERAIRRGFRGWVALARSPQSLARRIWARGKAHHVWRAGQLALRWNLEKSKPPRRARIIPTPAAVSAPKERTMNIPTPSQAGLALIVGAGPGLGNALARRFAKAGMDIAVLARDGRRLEEMVQELRNEGVSARAYPCDVTNETQVVESIRKLCGDLDVPQLAIYNVEHFGPGQVVDIETSAFVECWRVNCLGAFLVGREVARAMLTRGRGTLIFTGATAATRGREGYANMAVGKWGQRALAQCMARELGPKGIHVAHVILDGGILSAQAPSIKREKMLDLFPEEIAETYLALHRQHPSTWTQELDLRPWIEKF